MDQYIMLDVEKIDFDTENPRIKGALIRYKDKITAERIHFALSSATSGESKDTSSFSRLKDSIRAQGEITIPITVTKKNNKTICIDGNTRLAIYKEFLKENTEGNWSKIKAIVKENLSQSEIEAIRVSAHLIGAREWPAYEKARYLHYLYNSDFMNYNEMINLCGGNKKEIQKQIDAYNDMNEYYRDIVDDTAFHIDRFSGFVELQRTKIKDAIYNAGLELKDFGEWIKDGKIYRLEDVRELPKVLCDDEAKEVFLQGGPNSIKQAVKIVEDKEDAKRSKPLESSKLEELSIYQIAQSLSKRIDELPFEEICEMRDKKQKNSSEHIIILEELMDRLKKLLENVSE